ncbi:MAG: FAD-binding and (Fe-S)-binding domain-containing protein [Thiohalomonadales bacterium]
MSTSLKKLYSNLNPQLEGYIACDDTTIRLYSTDASLFQIKPSAVAFPKSNDDCKRIVAFASANNLSITPRGAGTSLAGQAIGDGIVVDVSRFMDHIVNINPATMTATVQPGVIAESLNRMAAPLGLFFPPNPSTDNRCNIGGMVANNAWGTNAPNYGDTSDYVNEVEMVLADSSLVRFTDIEQQQLDDIFSTESLEAQIYKEVIDQVKQQRTHIQSLSWYTQSIPNNMAYRLHKLLNRVTDPQSLGAPFNMSQLICGSEGTLGLITEITLSLRHKPAHRNLLCVHFLSIYDALNAVPLILSQTTATIELLDKYLIDLSYENDNMHADNFWIDHTAQAILLIEIQGDDPHQLEKNNNDILANLENHFEQLHAITLLNEETKHAWRIRRSCLGMLFSTADNVKAESFIEDTAVPVQYLTDFTQRVKDVMSMLRINCVFYGSVSRGLIHIRPLLDLTLPLHREYLKEIQNQVAILVKQYGGTISAKHGDGRVRAKAIRTLLDKKYIDACLSIKKCFDPNNTFNPDTIFSEKLDLSNIRTVIDNTKLNIGDGDTIKILNAVKRCHGAAVCLQTSPELNMCPSYKAVPDEALSTRGRANIIRQSFTLGDNNETIIDHAAIDKALAHCLGCGACHTDCPTQIDMASVKMQWRHFTNNSQASSLENMLFKNFPSICHLLARFPSLSNALTGLPFSKNLLGTSLNRPFPRFSSTRFSVEVKKLNYTQDQSKRIIIINDIFSEYFDRDVGKSAVEVLSKMGFHVRLSSPISSLKILTSAGWFEQARAQLQELVAWLSFNARPDDIIIGLEPSEVLAIRNECVEISKGTSWYSAFTGIRDRIMLLDEFIVENQQIFVSKLSRSTFKNRNIILHTHCHQKANNCEKYSIQALKLLPNCSIQHVKTGCCGMAGYFGYQKENYDLSVKIAQLDLLPAISASNDNDLIVATGSSCRSQIDLLSDKTALHPSQIYSKYLHNLIE